RSSNMGRFYPPAVRPAACPVSGAEALLVEQRHHLPDGERSVLVEVPGEHVPELDGSEWAGGTLREVHASMIGCRCDGPSLAPSTRLAVPGGGPVELSPGRCAPCGPAGQPESPSSPPHARP